MRRSMLTLGAAVAIALPAMAHAQETCEQRSQNRVAGTALGAVAGALLGSAVSGHGHKTTGAVVGGVAGAVIGNQVAKGPKDCQHAYGWYDDEGRWHANNVEPNAAWGYYDRNGEWVEGRPADYRPVEYAPPRPDWDDAALFDGPGYPEFRHMELRIHDHIRDGVRDGVIHHDDARDLMQQLRDIRGEEMRQYRDHGDYLPPDDRVRLRMRLRELDRLVEQVRHTS